LKYDNLPNSENSTSIINFIWKKEYEIVHGIQTTVCAVETACCVTVTKTSSLKKVYYNFDLRCRLCKGYN
jgi:hypothetical protein